MALTRCFCLLGVLLCAPLWAQQVSAEPGTPAAQPATPKDALGRGTPRGTVLGFLSAAE